MSIDWKPMEPSEFNEVLDLLDNSFPISRERIQDDLNEILEGPPHLYGVIHRLKVDDGSPILGTATYGQIYDGDWQGEGFIRYWAVHPDYRRQKHGTWMLYKVMSDLQKAGSPCLALSILHSDHVVQAFFERLGFQRYVGFTPEDAAENTEKYGEHYGYVKWFAQKAEVLE